MMKPFENILTHGFASQYPEVADEFQANMIEGIAKRFTDCYATLTTMGRYGQCKFCSQWFCMIEFKKRL